MKWGFVPFILFSMFVHGQNQRFSKVSGYPGSGPWEPYVKLSSAHMGPNALPIPPLRWGGFRMRNEVDLTLNSFFASSDFTLNPEFRIQYTPLGGRMAFEIQWIPVEWFHYSESIRDDRNTWDDRTTGVVMGDLNLHTMIQVLTESSTRPGILMTVGVKIPTGQGLEFSRNTQALGYHLDLSVGKDLIVGSGTLRPFAMAGWNSYQTYSIPAVDQGPLYGLGMRYGWKKHQFNLGFRGYNGNIGNGDSPMILETGYRWTHDNLSLLVDLGYGIQDFPFTYLKLGWRYGFL